jgi:excisionase family DNA binding protein
VPPVTDLLVEAIRAAVRAEMDAALDSRLSPLLAALKAAAPPARGLSPAEYAAQHSVSVWTVRRRIADGTLPHQRIGKRIVISADAVQSPENHTEIERMAAEACGR